MCEPPLALATNGCCPGAFAEKRRKRRSVCHDSSHALYSLEEHVSAGSVDGLIPLSVPRKARSSVWHAALLPFPLTPRPQVAYV